MRLRHLNLPSDLHERLSLSAQLPDAPAFHDPLVTWLSGFLWVRFLAGPSRVRDALLHGLRSALSMSCLSRRSVVHACAVTARLAGCLDPDRNNDLAW
jgi:hypothetical protein